MTGSRPVFAGRNPRMKPFVNLDSIFIVNRCRFEQPHCRNYFQWFKSVQYVPSAAIWTAVPRRRGQETHASIARVPTIRRANFETQVAPTAFGALGNVQTPGGDHKPPLKFEKGTPQC